MNINELKANLHLLVDATEDQELLYQIYELFCCPISMWDLMIQENTEYSEDLLLNSDEDDVLLVKK